VRFVTEYDEFRIIDTPFAVPSKLGRHGLSEVVNHLLERDDHQPFDFLIQGRLVRTPLSKFILLNGLSTEEIIAIEYFPAANLSDESENIDAPAWVGALDSTSSVVASGCYNGQVKFYDANTLAEFGALQAHEDPVRAIVCWEMKGAPASKGESNKGGSLGAVQMMATASKDNTVKVWSGTVASGAVSFRHVATLLGHMSSVESLGRWESQNRLLSGDWAGNLYAWDLEALSSQLPASQQQDGGAAKKKRKNSEGDVAAASATGPVELKPLFTIKAHGQCVSGISSVDSANTVITCSWDHSLKKWDLSRQDCICTAACSKVFTSVHRGAAQAVDSGVDTVLSSHPDGKVRLWELRAGQEASSAKASFGKTAQWISQVGSPTPEMLVVSCTDNTDYLLVYVYVLCRRAGCPAPRTCSPPRTTPATSPCGTRARPTCRWAARRRTRARLCACTGCPPASAAGGSGC
jgi:ribosome biogenesis protein YTM1